MSAIWGLLRFDGCTPDRRDLDRMGAALAAWGNDGGGVLVHDSIGLGQRQRHVNREDRFEVQPIHDSDARLTIVGDIRLDNREVLIAALDLDPGAAVDWPDSAFLAPGYRQWGEALPEHLIGDFAFAVWDAAARKLVLARDHMGQRGLYWHAGAEFFAFATQIEALWTLPEVPRGLCDVAFARRLTMERTPRPGATPYRDIAALEKASVMTVSADGRREERTYWRPAPAKEHIGRDRDYYLSTYRAVLLEAVQCRVGRLTEPPALLMSGAFDSGTIAVMAGQIAADRGHRLIALSEVLPEGVSDPCAVDARAAVEAFRAFPWIDIHYRTEGDRALYPRLEAELALHGIAATTQYVERELAMIASRQGARLLMDGYGGDYTLHVRSPHMLGQLLRRGRIGTFLREFRARIRRTGHSPWFVARYDVAGALIPSWVWQAIAALRRDGPVWREGSIADSFACRMIAAGDLQPEAMRIRPSPNLDWRAACRAIIDRVGRQQSLRQTVSRTGMEFTRPFHDKRVVELAMALPDDVIFRDGLDRWLPRHALRDVLPERLIDYAGGNTPVNPDQFAILQEAVPQMLVDLQALASHRTLARYIDLPRIRAQLSKLDKRRRGDHRRLRLIAQALMLVRHRLWFERANR